MEHDAGVATTMPAPAAATGAPSSAAKFSREQRKEIINDLIARRAELAEGLGGPDAAHDNDGNSSISGATRSLMQPYLKFAQQQQQQQQQQLLPGQEYSGGGGGEYSYEVYDGYFGEDGVSPGSGGQPAPYPMYQQHQQYYHQQQAAFDYPVDARTNRLVRHEGAIREEMFRECTFRPKIKELPASYGVGKAETPRDGTFYDRVIRWKEAKEKATSLKKQQVARTRESECTFQPRMNTNSDKAARAVRGQRVESNLPVNERLYRSSEASYAIREKKIEEELLKERTAEDQECTFRPKLATAGKFAEVKPKFLQQKKKPDPHASEARHAEACSFTPKVKGVNKHMHSAREYLSANVVERLSGVSPDPYVGPRPSADAAAFLAGRSGNNQLFDSPSSADRGRRSFGGTSDARRSRSASAPRGGAAGRRARTASPTARSRDDQHAPLSGGAKHRARDQRLQEFLGRQQQFSLRVQKEKEKLSSASTPDFKPALCRKSLELSAQHFKGEFLDRVERDVLRRYDAEQKAFTAKDFSCTFQPQLSKKVETMKARSVYEMSRGDLLRRETSQRMMKLRAEREEVEELTFQPEISKVGKSVQSSLKLKEDPAFFLQHYKGLENGKARRRALEQQRRVQREMEGCTFSPQLHECPEYVKRIAQSMHELRASRSMDAAHAAPAPPPKFVF